PYARASCDASSPSRSTHARASSPTGDTSHYFSTSTPPAEPYTLSLHDALPISGVPLRPATGSGRSRSSVAATERSIGGADGSLRDRKSTRLNSSHVAISYAVFCSKKTWVIARDRQC